MKVIAKTARVLRAALDACARTPLAPLTDRLSPVRAGHQDPWTIELESVPIGRLSDPRPADRSSTSFRVDAKNGLARRILKDPKVWSQGRVRLRHTPSGQPALAPIAHGPDDEGRVTIRGLRYVSPRHPLRWIASEARS